MISSPNRSSRGGKTVRLVVVHTAEGARTTAALGNYFARASVQASSHAGIDDQGIETYVPYDQAAWTLRSGNPISENVELCGFAAWSREVWLGQHRRMLELTAAWIRERCIARRIPIRKLTPAQVGAGEAGVCGHVDWTLGVHDGSHTDPGPGFPWDVVIDLATAPQSQEDDMPLTPADADLVADRVWSHMIYNNLLGREEWARTVLGADQDRVIRQNVVPLQQAVTALQEQVKEMSQLIAALANPTPKG